MNIKYLFMSVLWSKSIFVNLYGAGTPHTLFVPMTCGQNLYTQYHKLIFSDEDTDQFCSAYQNQKKCLIVADCSATYRYIQSRNSSNIASYLWGSDQLVFQGSDIEDRKSNALIAEYFGMGPDTNIFASMSPSLKNQVLDLQIALSSEKAWFQINIPLTWAKWKPQQGCSTFEYQGDLGKNNLDDGQVELLYGWNGGVVSDDGMGTLMVNGTELTTIPIGGTAGCVWFDNRDDAPAGSSIVGQLQSQNDLTNATLENIAVDTFNGLTTRLTVLADGGAVGIVENYNQSMYVGIIPVGLYGKAVSSGTLTPKSAVLYLNVGVDTVPPVNSANLAHALGQTYAFGKTDGRINNNFNFNACTKFNIADLPMMLGYDFYKSDAAHLGAYIKCVLPTGTKIDENFIQYVLTPVIGNGRHFELGLGVSGHVNFGVCDQSAYTFCADGYINKMFGSFQNRVFDLPGQPMSRYALAYPVVGNGVVGYTVDAATMVSLGDVNIYNGNVSACRGEFMFDLIYNYCNYEMGIGYAFAGQSAESICSSCQYNKNEKNQFGIVGQAAQNLIGIGIATPSKADVNDAIINNNFTFQAATPTTPAVCTIAVNFFDLGMSNRVSTMNQGESAAYSYGEVAEASSDSLAPVQEFTENCSGLMGSQILNRIFGHIDYVWRDSAWQPELGIVGSLGFSPCNQLTASYWDLGARFGFVF